MRAMLVAASGRVPYSRCCSTLLLVTETQRFAFTPQSNSYALPSASSVLDGRVLLHVRSHACLSACLPFQSLRFLYFCLLAFCLLASLLYLFACFHCVLVSFACSVGLFLCTLLACLLPCFLVGLLPSLVACVPACWLCAFACLLCFCSSRCVATVRRQRRRRANLGRGIIFICLRQCFPCVGLGRKIKPLGATFCQNENSLRVRDPWGHVKFFFSQESNMGRIDDKDLFYRWPIVACPIHACPIKNVDFFVNQCFV